MGRSPLWLVAGALLGAVLGWHLAPRTVAQPPSPDCPTAQQLALLEWENRMLVAMVQAGLQGDIAGHLDAFGAMQAPSTQPEPPSRPAPDPRATSEANADALLVRLQWADLKLQRQALAEGWATDVRLVTARRDLWDQARRQLTDREFMAALYRADQPNRLSIDTVRPGSEAQRQGLRHGDILWALDGQRTLTRDQYRTHLGTLAAEAPVSVSLRRDGETLERIVTGLEQAITLTADSVPPPP
ncbi:PDZ domain-containing protein [Ferrimonas balearica]|uniref:PDZ domain-containing protein n=1 Tax=Ferrimonas balearica TaxID=44012 RepID=UPI001C993A02|nr:PDZ domain-containing protein [Ferrimonas balearica]MBY5994168.1 PDZ domain-containing protein [Ferrimonas balearica]